MDDHEALPATTTGAPRPTDEHAGGLGRARAGLLVIAFATFAAVTTEMLPMGLLPAIATSFDASESDAGRIVSLYAAVVAIGAVPLTIATRRLPGKLLMLGAVLVYAASNLLSALAPDLAVLAVARFVGGATHALFFSVAIGYASRLVPPRLTGRALALASSGIAAGFVFGVPLATALGNAVGWRAACGALVGVMLVAALLVVFALPDVRTHDDAAADGLEPGRRRDLVAVVAANSLAFLAHFTLYTYVSVLLLESGVPLVLVAPVLLGFGALGMLGIWGAGRHLDRAPRGSAVVVVGLLGVGIGGVALGFPLVAAALIAGAVWCTAYGPMPSLFQNAAVQTRASSPEMAGALINASSNIGIAAGAFIGGLVLDALDLRAVAWVGVALAAAAIATILVSRRAFPASPAARG